MRSRSKPTVTKIFDKVLLLVYEKRSDVAKAFCRVQEHYECQDAEFRGQTFTLGEFREWYTDKFGQWTYFKDWSGFNVPADQFKKFIAGSFDPLTEHEAELVKIMRYVDPAYYVIATYAKAKEDVFLHETAHALYATDPHYRSRVNLIFAELDNEIYEAKKNEEKYTTLDPLVAKLKQMGYADNVIMDEVHAYLATDQEWLREENIDYPRETASRLRSNLLRIVEDVETFSTK